MVLPRTISNKKTSLQRMNSSSKNDIMTMVKWHKMLLGSFVFLILVSSELGATKDMKELCQQCKIITDAYKKGLQKTAKSNFGGGNTNWEQKSLGSYLTSETRFLEIFESLCTNSLDEKKCHHLVESNEEMLEHFWFKVAKNNQDLDIYKWLCVDEKDVDDFSGSSLYQPVCCPAGHFGPQCESCSGGSATPCSGRGKCDGDATRAGTGKCLCDTGYRGQTCAECADSYFNDQTSTNENGGDEAILDCKACHISCQTCSSDGPEHCLACRPGYTKNLETNICDDIDECKTANCGPKEYCSNTLGSYVCMACDRACDSCYSGGADKCRKCQSGFVMEENKCVDFDECADGTLCTKDRMYCLNTPGSYKCECKSNYELLNGECLMRPPTPESDGKNTKKKRGGVKTEDMFKNVSPYTVPIFYSTIGLFGATGHYLRGHTVGSVLLVVAMSLTIYRIASNFG